MKQRIVTVLGWSLAVAVPIVVFGCAIYGFRETRRSMNTPEKENSVIGTLSSPSYHTTLIVHKLEIDGHKLVVIAGYDSVAVIELKDQERK